jgi:hypothetical protein
MPYDLIFVIFFKTTCRFYPLVNGNTALPDMSVFMFECGKYFTFTGFCIGNSTSSVKAIKE